MKDIYLINYSVKGIKTLDQLVNLSFYKKTISKNMDTQNYNVKGIYGMNGSGKSGIITSVEILKNLIVNSNYLNNPIIQKELGELINKKNEQLSIEAEYAVNMVENIKIFNYKIKLSKNIKGKFEILYESLYERGIYSKNSRGSVIFEVENGEIKYLHRDCAEKEIYELIDSKTKNLLSTASMCALIWEKIVAPKVIKDKTTEVFFDNSFFRNLIMQYIFGRTIYIYLEQEDKHKEYLAMDMIENISNLEEDSVMNNFFKINNYDIEKIDVKRNLVLKTKYDKFKKNIEKLYEFLHIFKSDLSKIEIDKKENGDVWVCNLIMVYDDYKIDAEFESTGIKKLIKLFVYLKEMVKGGIVFIDEFDSNLHDVYLCALLEYLMEYGKGQLCFTTHNVGPMDILKQHKKSIDFLSENHKIYPWTTNGNYSPSKLYRSGMIEGSPFNVDSIDFIGVFGSDEEAE